MHTGKPLSFVYDVADVFKFDTVVPVAFRIAAKNPFRPDQEVRIACRDIFRETRLLRKIIPSIEKMLAAGGISPPRHPRTPSRRPSRSRIRSATRGTGANKNEHADGRNGKCSAAFAREIGCLATGNPGRGLCRGCLQLSSVTNVIVDWVIFPAAMGYANHFGHGASLGFECDHRDHIFPEHIRISWIENKRLQFKFH